MRASLSALCLLTAGTAIAQPTGSFVAMMDKQNNNGDSRQSIVFFDVDDLSAPLFSVFAGEKIAGDNRSPVSLTVDPSSGDVYFLAEDRDDAAGVFVAGSPADNIPDNTEGSYDLLKIPFATVYNQWQSLGGGYTTFNPGPFGHPAGQNTNEVQFNAAIEKIGEIARPTFYSGEFFDTHLEFVDQDTLLVVDRPIAQIGFESPPLSGNFPNNDPANDSQIRAIKRVSTSPGAATVNAELTEGGFNAGTTESWESVVLGQLQLDSASVSELDSIAYYKDAATGREGLWILESDYGTGPDATPGTADDFKGDPIAFFSITNYTGTAGNAYAEYDVGPGPTFGTTFQLDDNPVLDSAANDGIGDRIFVNTNTGALVIIESGFNDETPDEPSVITREVLDYSDENGRIDFGAWGYTQLDVSGADDDDSAVTDGRWTVYDSANNDVYFYDLDNTNDSTNGTGFDHDWYKLDLDTGVTTLLGIDADTSNGLFSNGDQFAFFNLQAIIEGIIGDFNNSGQVEQGDLDLVLQNWGDTDISDVTDWVNFAGLPGGGIDGQVEQTELDAVLSNWGDTSAPDFSGSSVPEPTSVAILAGIGAIALRRRSA